MNKRIIVIFVCLLLVIIPVILFAGVFVVHKISVVNKGDEFSYDQDKLIADSFIGYNSSIFVLSEKNATHNIELSNPNVKVMSIERLFPDKIEIFITERIPVFAIKLKSVDKYALLDRELKIVSITDSKPYDIDEAIFIGEDVDISEDDFKSQIIYVPDKDIRGYIMKGVIEGFESVGFANSLFTSIVKSIENKDNMIELTTTTGAVMEIPIISTDERVGIKDMVAGVFGLYKLDRESNATFKDTNILRVKNGIYYFEENVGWTCKMKDTTI